jgi:hypothetical protein
MGGNMKSYKYCALVKLDADADKRSADLPEAGGRIIVRAHHHESQHDKFFSALVNPALSEPLRPSDHSIQLAITVYGEHVDDYLEAGDTFALWRGHDIGQGIISRRLSFWAAGP